MAHGHRTPLRERTAAPPGRSPLPWIVLSGCVAACAIPRTGGTGRAPVAGEGQHPSWTPEMQLEYHRVTGPRLSPSGERVVFEVTRADLESDRWVPRLWLAPADGSAPAEALPCEGCRRARWGPSNGLLYLSAPDEEDRERVHALDLETGVRTPITPERDAIGWFEPSPDGRWIAYTTLDADSGSWSLHTIASTGEEVREWSTTGSIAEFSWSPGSDRIAAVHTPGPGLDWREKSLLVLDLTTGSVLQPDTGPGFAWLPQFHPNGESIAYVASPGPASWVRDFELRVLDLTDGSSSALASTPDRNIELLAWDPKGTALLGLEYEGSTRRLLSVPLDGGAPRYLGPAGRSLGTPHVRGSRIAFTSERWDEPVEVFVASLPDLRARRVSSVQPRVAAPLGHTTTERWRSDDGTEVEGLLTLPVGYREGVRVPLLVRLHGGPPFPASDGFIGRTYFTAYPFASMASAGFAILQPNFRGSAGYGRDFRRGLHGDWGGQDYRDVIAGVDALVARGIADPERLGVMGWSYGGYLSAWTITQDARFASASMGAAMTELPSWDETTSLKGMLGDWLGGSAEQRLRLGRERSPLTHVQNVRCSVLVQHGTRDGRVPIAQAKAFLSAMEGRGLDVEFRPYEGGHGPRTPSAELSVLQQNLDWFVRTLGEGAPDH